MSEDRPSTNWPWLVAGGMFELRTMISVVLGSVALLNSERAGPLTEQQRTFLQHIRQSTGQISDMVEALAGLASFEGAWSTSNSEKESVSLGKLLSEVGDLPVLQHAGRVDVRAHGQLHEIIAAPRLLLDALAGLARFVACDQLQGKRPLSIWIVDRLAASERWIVLAASEQIQEAVKTPRERLTLLNERAGRSLSMDLPFAGAIVRAHGGELLALPEGTPGAVVTLPRPAAASE
jgi:signal transduction histidine kinase